MVGSLTHSARAPNVVHLARLEYAAHPTHTEHVAQLVTRRAWRALGVPCARGAPGTRGAPRPNVAHMGV
eukprot:6162052-Pyramimonas_sp.AAC.1